MGDDKVWVQFNPEITPEAFIAWARANRDKLPSGVAEALGPERDWADELAHEYYDQADNLGLSAFIRTRCRPIRNDTVTDELLSICKTFVERVEAGEVRSKRTYEAMKAVIAKAEATQ